MSAGGQGGPGKRGFSGGKYGSAKNVRAKATNLSAAQLKRAGATKAAAKRTVDIGSTKRVAGKTLGPGGKPLTGSVKLANGQMAVYKAGKRVINVKPAGTDKPKPPPAPNAVTAAKNKMGKAAGYGKGARTPSNLTGARAGNAPTSNSKSGQRNTVGIQRGQRADMAAYENRPSARGILTKINKIKQQISNTTNETVKKELQRNLADATNAYKQIKDFFR